MLTHPASRIKGCSVGTETLQSHRGLDAVEEDTARETKESKTEEVCRTERWWTVDGLHAALCA